MEKQKELVSNQWEVGTISRKLKQIEQQVHQHDEHCGCGHDHDEEDLLEKELENLPPQGAGIVEVVRWAMTGRKTLRNPPIEHMFCGTQFACIYAGVLPTSMYKRYNNAKMAAKAHAVSFCKTLMTKVEPSEVEGKPPLISYPSQPCFLVIMDVNEDPDNPKSHFCLYDAAATISKCAIQIESFDQEDVERKHKNKQSGNVFLGMKPLAFEAFRLDLEKVVGDYIREQMREREEAIKQAQQEGTAEVIEEKEEIVVDGPDEPYHRGFGTKEELFGSAAETEPKPEPEEVPSTEPEFIIYDPRDEAKKQRQVERIEKRLKAPMLKPKERAELEKRLAKVQGKIQGPLTDPMLEDVDGENSTKG